MPDTAESIIERLKALVDRRFELAARIPDVQQAIWSTAEAGEDDVRWEILRDLAYDLDYYQPDERVRAGDTSLYGDERALSEIKEALAKLEAREDEGKS